VWLAGATGQPILPYHIEASRYWSAPSWDRTQIPKPFSTVALAIGRPLHIGDTQPATIEAGQALLGGSLAELEAHALQMLAADYRAPSC
jgi:lysophospholipid acyltransferase (LPLAT)-like uncharacterized protein